MPEKYKDKISAIQSGNNERVLHHDSMRPQLRIA
jgi:hypothetical protein